MVRCLPLVFSGLESFLVDILILMTSCAAERLEVLAVLPLVRLGVRLYCMLDDTTFLAYACLECLSWFLLS
jgi:hypothetical protein